MVKGTTKSGFKYSVDPENVKDMRFIELTIKVKRDGLYLPELIERALGEKQKEALYKHLEDSKGRVNVERVGEEFQQIMAAMNENDETKN